MSDIIISIGRTQFYLTKNSPETVARSMFTLIESQQDIVSEWVAKKHPKETAISISMSTTGHADRARIASWPHAHDFMQDVVKNALRPRFVNVIEGELV